MLPCCISTSSFSSFVGVGVEMMTVAPGVLGVVAPGVADWRATALSCGGTLRAGWLHDTLDTANAPRISTPNPISILLHGRTLVFIAPAPSYLPTCKPNRACLVRCKRASRRARQRPAPPHRRPILRRQGIPCEGVLCLRRVVSVQPCEGQRAALARDFTQDCFSRTNIRRALRLSLHPPTNV